MGNDDQSEGRVPGRLVAGFKLLDKFTAQWEQLHRVSETNIEKSRLVVDKLTQLDKSCKLRLEALDNFISNYKGLSSLERQISSISCDISNLENTFIKIEQCLSQLAEKRELDNFEAYIRQCEGNYEAQVQRENIRTELKRDQLMSEHLLRVCDFERKQQEALDERRRMLTDDFETEKASHINK